MSQVTIALLLVTAMLGLCVWAMVDLREVLEQIETTLTGAVSLASAFRP